MKAIKLDKDIIIKLVLLTAIAGIVALLNFRSLGVKDSAMVFAATFAVSLAITFAFKDKKKSLLLFIVSMPILVTARKAVYFDFFIFKITYETIYISFIFVMSFKLIINWIKDIYKNSYGRKFNFLLYIGVLLVFALNSTLYSYDVPRSIGYTFISVIIPIMFMLSAIVNFEKKDLEQVYYALFIQISFSSLYGFYQLFSSGKGFSDRTVLTFGYHNVNIYAGLVILIIPFMAELFLYGKRKLWIRLLIGAALLFNTFTLYITMTRGALLAFAAAILFIFVSKRYRWILYAIGVGSIFVAKPAFNYVIHRGTSTSLLANESSIARIQSFFTSFKIVLDLPFGVGAGNFAEFYKYFSIKGYLAMPDSLRNTIKVASYNLEAAHNLWLQIGVELGIICVIVFLVIILNRVFECFRNFNNNRPALSAIVAYLVFSLITGVEFEHKGVITITLVIWLIFGIIEINNREWDNDKSRNKGTFKLLDFDKSKNSKAQG